MSRTTRVFIDMTVFLRSKRFAREGNKGLVRKTSLLGIKKLRFSSHPFLSPPGRTFASKEKPGVFTRCVYQLKKAKEKVQRVRFKGETSYALKLRWGPHSRGGDHIPEVVHIPEVS